MEMKNMKEIRKKKVDSTVKELEMVMKRISELAKADELDEAKAQEALAFITERIDVLISDNPLSE